MGWVVFVLGLCVGSFLNVVIYRLPRGLSFIGGRSFCPRCKKKIAWLDNIPLISFLLLRGRCRRCRSPIAWRYPVVELLTGVLFYLSFLSYLSILSYILFSALIAVFFIDLEHQVIPDKILVPLILLFSFRAIVLADFSLFAVAFLSSLFFYLLFLATRGRGMGLGDVKLAFLMGLCLGYPEIVVSLYLAFLTGAALGIILILSGKAKFGQKIPFGPFLSGATIMTCLWGEKIIHFVGGLLF